MRGRLLAVMVSAALTVAGRTARADVWDQGNSTDNFPSTRNELVHGLDQVHDLSVQGGGTYADLDFYRFEERCNASYEVVVDGMTGDVVLPNGGYPTLDLLDSDGSTVLGSSLGVTPYGAAQRLTALCTAPTNGVYHDYRVRVANPNCALLCTSNDQYRIHFRETTLALPRFNNTNGQATTLIVQNTTEEAVSLVGVAFDATGAPIVPPVPLPPLAPGQAVTVSLASYPSLANRAGSIRVLNDAPYGALAGKGTALDPATGFTFDTPLVYRAH